MDINELPAELQEMLAQYQANKGLRSPVSRPLLDLRDPSDPKKRLHRPNYFFETGPDLPTYRHQEYPKIKWHQSGTDTLVLTREAETALGAEWSDVPSGKALDPADQVQAEMMALTPEEREMVLEAHRTARIESIRKKMANLSEADLAKIVTPEKKGRKA